GNPGLGGGANLGVLPSTAIDTGAEFAAIRDVGMVFDQQAPRPIVDGSAAAPFASHFPPETGGLDFGGLNLFNGFHLNRPGPDRTDFINGTWYLRITDVFNSNETPKPFQNLDSWGMNFTSGLSTTSFGADTTAVIGSFEGVLPESITGLGAATLEV